MDQEEEIKSSEKNPREKANIFQILTFWFAFPILKKARNKDIQDTDIYQVLPKYDSQKLGNHLETQWLKSNEGKQKSSFSKCVLKCFIKYYMLLGFIQLIMKVGVVTILQPKAFSKFVAYFEKDQTKISETEVFGWAALVIGLNMFCVTYNHNFMQALGEYAITIRTSICSVIFRKALKISPLIFSDSTMGKVVTLITKDVFSIDGAIIFLNDIWIGMVQTIIVTIILYKKIGYSVFAGIGFFLLVVPIQAFCARTSSLTRIKTAKKTEERLQYGNEILSAIKMIKMYTWENYFERLITDARTKETSKLKIIYYLKSLILVLGVLTSKVALFLTIVTYVSTGSQTSAELVYFIQQSFFALRSCITISIPVGITYIAELSAAFKRIEEFLKLEEFVKKGSESSVANPKIYLNKVSMHIKQKEILRSVSFEIEKGILIISGNLGSGKSSILKTILNEYPISSGELMVRGSISYAPEEPWLFPSSIKQNILFGQQFDEKRYQDVLNVCALTYDLNQFEDFDDTIIGDKGINLSKGQKARISLARAVYKNSDIYLLDDCLSALDGEVNKHVFRECIKSFLKDKICILITNNFNNIKQVPISSVIYMEDGKTLDLDQQRAALDKRITYYIDEDSNNPYVSYQTIPEDEELNLDAKESDTLIMQRRPSQARKSIYYEETKKGKVLLKNYISYYRYTGGIAVLIFIVTLFIACQATLSMSEKFLSVWVNVQANYTKLIQKNLTDSEEFNQTITKRDNVMNLYTIMILASSGLSLIRAFANFYFCTRAGRNLHNVLVKAILHSYMTFFDYHYKGHILNRLSKDMYTIDESVPFVIYENMRSIFLITATMALIASVNTLFLIPAAVLFCALFFIQRFYIPTGRSIKRLEAATRSPMVGYINASLEGLTTVRACEQEQILKLEFDRHQDLYTSVFYMNLSTSRWFAFWLDIMCSGFIASIVLKFVIFPNGVPSGNVGLALSQAMMLTGMLQFAMRQAAELENTMTSVERILEYADVEKEPTTGKVLQNWPEEGAVKFKNVKLQYRTTGETALKGVTFEIEGRSKVGIVGRTGAGKSSIISVLFRLYDFDGEILIDNEDIQSLNLELLRSKIGIIPQDPILFSGTIRTNIDPLNCYKDEEIWKSIEKVQMKRFVASLDQKIDNGGKSFSSGQRQLICLARALISNNRIIVLDEATASIDPNTDQMIQKTIKENFEDCTVLTIAHRLNTFTKSDKILVVEDGKVVQFDDPETLLKDIEGVFYRMVKKGDQNSFF